MATIRCMAGFLVRRSGWADVSLIEKVPYLQDWQQRSGPNELLNWRQVPAGIDPSALAPDKNLCRAPGAGATFALRIFQFIEIGRVDDSRVAINLHLGLWKFKSKQLVASLPTLLG